MSALIELPLKAALGSMDQSRDQLLTRLAGLTDSEYLWEPAPGCWTVRPRGEGFVADQPEDEPQPAPLTTIAWRIWHITVDCMDSYSRRAFGTSGTGLTNLEFVAEATQAVDLLEAAIANFRRGVTDMGAACVWDPLGGDWGAYAQHTYFGLLLHAHRELTHHGAEIGTLRDLYLWTHGRQ